MRTTFLMSALAALLYGTAASPQAYPTQPQSQPLSGSTQDEGVGGSGDLGEDSPDVGDAPELGGDVSQKQDTLPPDEGQGGSGQFGGEVQEDTETGDLGQDSPDVGASSPEMGGDVSQEPAPDSSTP